MKICTIQPPYGFNRQETEQTFEFILQELNRCDESIDLILTPEYSNSPGTLTAEESLPFAQAHRARLEEAARNAARRCHALTAISYCAIADGCERNTTRIFRPDGSVAGEYWKQQLVLSEPAKHGVDASYTRIPRTPTIVEADGLRFGFVICYDAYFEEYIAALARCKPDIVLVSAMQRQEPSENLRLLNRTLAYHTNAFVVRSSYSMGKDAVTGGTSLVIAPDGRILADMEEKTGSLICEIGDPHWKYCRTNSFQGAMIRNDEFIEQGRTPWVYRPCGPFIRLNDRQMPYPRICAHRGFHTTLPENTMPAFGAAVALGADEIEFDLWETADGVPVSCHDRTLERVSSGTGDIRSKTLTELQQLDFAKGCDDSFRGLKIPTLEEILQKFARQTIMNIHLKSEFGKHYSRSFMQTVANLIRQYDCVDHVYFMGSPDVHEAALEICPEIARCMGADGDMEKMQIVDWAAAHKCAKVQLFKPYFSQKLIDDAHDRGILCNVFWSDDPSEARLFWQMGIDTVLTNNYFQVFQARKRLPEIAEKSCRQDF